MTATYWFSPAPSEISSSRISLDFDLRAADIFFRELVVPQLGRIWFARQVSWPLAALTLHEELASRGSNAPKPTAICHGIEALACKLQYLFDSEDRSRRILGRRAFGRDTEREVWSFRRLRQAINYVRNTHRQAATRALQVDGGLGFARGSRFDLLEMERVGRDLANAFLEQRVGQGGTSLRKWLLGWLNGDHEVSGVQKTLLNALSPEYATDTERALVRSRLLGASTPERFCEKRQRLARAVGRAADLPDIETGVIVRLREAGHLEQANEIVAARAFGAVLDRARDAVANLTRAVEPERGGVKLVTLARDPALRKSIKNLRLVSNNYINQANTANVKEATSRSFANAIVAADDPETIRLLVRRADEVLWLADGSLVRGPLFRIVNGADESRDLEDGAENIEPDRTGRTFRIANLHSLLRDVDQRGTR
jgi:hypothetical protein